MNGYKRVYFRKIDSTNDYAKALRETGENTVVFADGQTGGRGTKGRSFSSEEGGVYLSTLTFYKNFPAKNAFLIMAGVAVAVCRTLAFYGLTPKIKWANDVFVGEKKICGILIENVFSGNRVSSSVVGIGLNVCNRLPSELKEIATTLQAELGKSVSVDEVRERLLEELSHPASMDEYRELLGFLGREVVLICGDEELAAILVRVDDDGGLIARIGGEEKKFHAGEVSLRL